MPGPLSFTAAELRVLSEHRQVRFMRDAVEPTEVEPDESGDVGLEGPRPRLYRIPSGEECRQTWLDRWPTLATTDALMARIDPLRQELLEALQALPMPPTGRGVPRAVIEAQAERVRELRRAVGMFACFVHAVESVRATVAFFLDEEDPSPMDVRAIGASVMGTAAYRAYDRWRVRVARLDPRVRAMERRYDRDRNSTRERREYMREYMRARRAQFKEKKKKC